MIRIAPPYLEVFQIIEADVLEIWELLVDTQRWREWGPSIREVECRERHIRLDSVGRVRTPLGIWVPFRITGFETCRSWSWEVWGIKATGHRVEALEGGCCRLVFQVPLWAFPYSIVCILALQRIVRIASKRGSSQWHSPL
ncbi:MAG: SRPBCC family protein [Deltaproteobacteria bacterium]|nr:SRPBCC family protein [Deltaproteobacteria bacterium]